MGVMPKDFIASYEMPGAIVSSEPDLCVEALRRLVEDAKEVAARAGVGEEQLLVFGWSMGSGPATYFANSMGARLRSVASADRGDLLLWESSVVRDIKERAIGKGYQLQDFSEASRGYHPSENLANLRPGSKFVISLRDEFVPQARRRGLVRAVRRHAPGAEITYCDAGHVKTIVAGVAAPREA